MRFVSDHSGNRERWKTGALIFAVFTVYLLMRLPQFYLQQARSPYPVSWWITVARLAIDVYLWGLLTPLIFRLGNRFPISRRHLWRNLLIHIFFSFLFGVAQTLGYHFGLMMLVSIPLKSVIAFLSNAPYVIDFSTKALFHYVVILAVHQAFLYFREIQDKEFRLQQSELQVLKAQLNPHFLFNTLNAISALIHSSPLDADYTLTRLSNLLRISLKSGKTQEVSLKAELDFLKNYLQIHKTLMENRLEVKWDVGAETLNALVPSMILQPLVENSIQHGIAPLERGGIIEISAERNDGHLYLTVRDNGCGLFIHKTSSGTGIGLANTQARLEHLYGERHEFNLNEPFNGGLTVNIKIPFREKA